MQKMLRKATVAWGARVAEKRLTVANRAALVRLGRQMAQRRRLYAWRLVAAGESALIAAKVLEGEERRTASVCRKVLTHWQSCVHFELYLHRLSCIWANDSLRKRVLHGWWAAAVQGIPIKSSAGRGTTDQVRWNNQAGSLHSEHSGWTPQPAGKTLEGRRRSVAQSNMRVSLRAVGPEIGQELQAWGQAGLEKRLLVRFMCRKALSICRAVGFHESALTINLERLLRVWHGMSVLGSAIRTWRAATARVAQIYASEAENRPEGISAAEDPHLDPCSWSEYGFPTFHHSLATKSRTFAAWVRAVRRALAHQDSARRSKDALLCELKGLFSSNRFEQVADLQFAATRVREVFREWTGQVLAGSRLEVFASRLGSSRVLLRAMCSWAALVTRRQLSRYKAYATRNAHHVVAYCRSEEAFGRARERSAARWNPVPSEEGDDTPQSSPLAPEQLFCDTVCDRSAAAVTRHIAPDTAFPEMPALRSAAAEIVPDVSTPGPRGGTVNAVLTRYLTPPPPAAPAGCKPGLARCLATLKARQSAAKGVRTASPTGPFSPGAYSCASTPSPQPSHPSCSFI